MKYEFSKSIYPKEVLIKSAYVFTDRAYIHLDENDKYYIVNIEYKGKPSFNYDDFKNEMLAQTVRMEIYKKTKDIRKLTIARAFASTVIDELPNDDSEDEIFDMDRILNDWFEENEEN